MNRVLIIGCCGAGKSTLSYKIAEITGLPLIHLDKEYFLSGWVTSDEDEWVEKVKMLIAKDSWIIEGNYAGSLDRRLSCADTVIELRMP